jgi:hypothetical protein
LNKSQLLPNANGTTVYVLSASDPGVHNWIDTVGLREGWMLLRWQGVPPSTDPAQLIGSVRTVKLDHLHSALPPDTPTADLRSRSAQINSRIAGHASRFS